VTRSRSSVASGAVWFAIPPSEAGSFGLRQPRVAAGREEFSFGRGTTSVPRTRPRERSLHGCEPASEACRFGGTSTGQRTSVGLRAHVNATLRRGRDSCRTRLTFEHLGRSPRSLLFGGDRRRQPSTVPSLPSGMRSTGCARASVRASVDIGPAASPLRRLADGSTARARTHPGASGLRARPPSCVHLSSRTCECGEAMSVVSTGSAFGPTSWGGPRPLSAWATAPIGFGRADAVSHRVASGSASADLGASRGVPHPASRRMTDVHRPSGPTSVGLGVPRGSLAVDTNGPWRRPSGQSSGHPVHGEEVREPEGPFGDPRFRLLCIGRCFAIEVFGPRARDTRGCFRVCQRQQRPAAASFGSGTPERCSTSFGGLVHRGTATVGPTSVGRPAHRLRPIRSVTSRSSRWCKTRLATLVRRFADAEGSA
jgi:hypothetical protein